MTNTKIILQELQRTILFREDWIKTSLEIKLKPGSTRNEIKELKKEKSEIKFLIKLQSRLNSMLDAGASKSNQNTKQSK